ncbi:acyl-CoA--6-aminopenicillanic acid acyl-transferase [Acinetobacter sp. B10A]|uniref:C45 family autoproteolytic acyltransferase/hydolase n=1 Tax=Acinetobacter baretiae TaxID=2605383 RepID=UPI001B3C6103|nr:C45 family peptidase [Acinetobacter baretiae]MBF7685572.1 acyl-CoA--6-aminopenicillanic acid acyl-transferase [Acinetobacter baretiae]
MNIFNISGTPAQIGEQLGQLGKAAWHTKIKHTELWQQLQPFQHSEQILALQQLVYADFPEIWEEVVGLAKGLDDDVMTVFLWNCRGDVLSSTFDGCTTIIGKNTQGHTIVAHNEDGLPELIDDCFLVNATTSEGVSFFSFAYPASLCGHTFSVNCFGIVNTVNNLRIKTKNQGYPRQILARAALNQTDIQDVLNLLLYARVGGFHHTLVQKKPHQKTCALSVEALGQRSQVVDVQEIGLHANHVIYDDSTEQIITRSSKERQHRLESLFDGQI